MERWSHREFKTRLAWIEEQWNRPDRTDYHLMRIAQRIQQFQQGFGKSTTAIELEDQGVKFATPGDEKEKKPYDPVAATKAAKAGWFARLQGK